jgi:beta-lactamase class A
MSVTRRGLLTGMAGCADSPSPSPSPPSSASPSAARPPVDLSRYTALERRHRARLGVYALATGTGATVVYRADERFAFCSTFKTLAAAAVLHGNPLSHLSKRVRYTSADVDSISPVTEHHVATGMTIRQLCDAAIRYSDGTAGNLLMRDLGGPGRLTAYLRLLGDHVSRMDRYEPWLNRDNPHDPRDTTTPRAIAATYRALVLGDALPADKRALLVGWLSHTAGVGAKRVAAGLPSGWRLVHKTGTGDYGRANDIAITWPPGAAPYVIAVMSDRHGYHTPAIDALVAEAARLVVADLAR